MREKINTVLTATGSAAGSERQLRATRAQLDQQRRFRTEQLEDLAVDAAEAMASSDQSRLQVTRVLTLAAEAALSEIDAALQRLEDGSYGICEHCVEPIPWQRLETLHTVPVPRRVRPVQQRRSRQKPIWQRNPMKGP